MKLATLGRRFAGAMSAALTFDPVHPRDAAISKMLGVGGKTEAGVRVDHLSVMGLPAVMRAVNILSNGVAKVPFYVFKESEDGGRTWDRKHQAWRAVAVKPCAELSGYTFRKTMTAWAILWGNAVAYIDRGIDSRRGIADPLSMVPLLPDRTFPIRVTQRMVERYDIAESMLGKLYYSTTVDGRAISYDAANCLHIRGLGPNPHWGYDIVEVLREAFGGAAAAQSFGNLFYGNGANPAGIIEMPAGLDEEAEERFAASIKRGMEGMGRAHRVMLLEEGSKFHQLTIDPAKAQFLEGKQFDIRLLAMAIGIKVHKLIDSANSSFNSLEQANQEHKDDDLMPWIKTWEAEMADKLLTAEQINSGSHSIGIDDEALEWSPFGDRSKGVVELYNNGLIDKDEGRRRVNFGPSKTPFASRYRMPANIGWESETAAVVATADPEPPQDDSVAEVPREEIEAALQQLKASNLLRIARRLGKLAASKAAKKDGGKEFLAWVDSLASEEAPVASMQGDVDALYGSLRDAMTAVADTAKAEELEAAVGVAVAEWIAKYEAPQ